MVYNNCLTPETLLTARPRQVLAKSEVQKNYLSPHWTSNWNWRRMFSSYNLNPIGFHVAACGKTGLCHRPVKGITFQCLACRNVIPLCHHPRGEQWDWEAKAHRCCCHQCRPRCPESRLVGAEGHHTTDGSHLAMPLSLFPEGALPELLPEPAGSKHRFNSWRTLCKLHTLCCDNRPCRSGPKIRVPKTAKTANIHPSVTLAQEGKISI